jgi:hypothetical protein
VVMVDAAHPPLNEQPEILDVCIEVVVVALRPDKIDSYPLLVRLGRSGCLGRIQPAVVFAVVVESAVGVGTVIVVVVVVAVGIVVVVAAIVVVVVAVVVVGVVVVVTEMIVGFPAFV